MPFVNFMTREINLKIVYAGCPIAGRMTSLSYLHDTTAPERCSKKIALMEQDKRFFFYDFCPNRTPKVRGFTLRFHMNCVVGVAMFGQSPKNILQGVDGIVFVADSTPSRRASNIDFLNRLRTHLTELNRNPDSIPLIFQYNKRDLDDRISLDDLQDDLNPSGRPFVESIASKGVGVWGAFYTCAEQVIATHVANGFSTPKR